MNEYSLAKDQFVSCKFVSFRPEKVDSLPRES